MKFVIMFAASALSAMLVLPTVSQGQSSSSIHQQAAAALGHAASVQRSA